MTVEAAIESVARLSPRPGETVVLKTGCELRWEEIEDINARLQAQFPGLKTIILAPGWDISVSADEPVIAEARP